MNILLKKSNPTQHNREGAESKLPKRTKQQQKITLLTSWAPLVISRHCHSRLEASKRPPSSKNGTPGITIRELSAAKLCHPLWMWHCGSNPKMKYVNSVPKLSGQIFPPGKPAVVDLSNYVPGGDGQAKREGEQKKKVTQT